MKYNFDEVVDRKGTYCTQWDYVQDRFGQADLLPFTISDTDFKIPVPITEKIREITEHQIYGYSRWNHDDFKGSITSFYKRRFNCNMKNEWVLYSPSVMYSISLLIRLLSEKGDKVLTFDPMYDAFINVITQNDRQLVPHLLDRTNGFTIDFAMLNEQLKECKILLLCAPHNPSGRIWSKNEMDQIIQLCKENDVKIISDEIHMDIRLKEAKHIPLLTYYSEYEGLYTASSCSKTLNVPGLIESYVIIPDERIRDLFLHQTRTKDFLNSVSIFGMYATMIGYKECDDYIDQLNEYIIENMKYVEAFLKVNLPDFHFEMPEATYLAWIDATNVPFTTEEIQDALVNVGKVAIMKGEVYGKNGEKYLRMNCGCPKSKLEDGLNRMKKAMDWLYSR